MKKFSYKCPEKSRDEDPDPLIFGPPDPDPTYDNGLIKLFSF